jgi:cell division protein ZapE
MQMTLWQKYQAAIHTGGIHPDPQQAELAMELQQLGEKLIGYHPKSGQGVLAALQKWRGGAVTTPKGLYIHGGVGRGKTMLMDWFFESVPSLQKKRSHFHAFMQNVHERLHAMRKVQPDLADPLLPLAKAMADEAWLLCFDEFVVHDIADAMILSRLFGALFEYGVVVVATSNVAPDDLYRDGLHRERFLPFIEILRQHVAVFHYDGGRDYRRLRLQNINRYNYPLNAAAEQTLAQAFAELASGQKPAAEIILTKGHALRIEKTANGVAMTDFANLCGGTYAAGDYLALAQRFHTLILSGVPQFGGETKNEARRFITLIDVCYDKKRQIICSASAPILDLGGNPPILREFERTQSRLLEMQDPGYGQNKIS